MAYQAETGNPQPSQPVVASQPDASIGLAAISTEALCALALSLGWRLLVLFGSSVRRGARADAHPRLEQGPEQGPAQGSEPAAHPSAMRVRGRDIDLAVLPGAMPDLLEQGRWQVQLEQILAPCPVDLLLLGAGTSPVTRFEVFRHGKLLFEENAGLFERERDRAFFLYADSEWFRKQQREALYGAPG